MPSVTTLSGRRVRLTTNQLAVWTVLSFHGEYGDASFVSLQTGLSVQAVNRALRSLQTKRLVLDMDYGRWLAIGSK